MSKPVCLREGEDSSKSSESSESNSSEETASHVEPSQDPLQPALTETGVPNAIEETDPPGHCCPTSLCRVSHPQYFSPARPRGPTILH
ncbi:mucin-2-like isoform X1 [Lates japonicus]